MSGRGQEFLAVTFGNGKFPLQRQRTRLQQFRDRLKIIFQIRRTNHERASSFGTRRIAMRNAGGNGNGFAGPEGDSLVPPHKKVAAGNNEKRFRSPWMYMQGGTDMRRMNHIHDGILSTGLKGA